MVIASWVELSMDTCGRPPATSAKTWFWVRIDYVIHLKSFRLVGQSRLLTLALPTGTPIGILLDRLEECPSEVEGADPELVREAVAYLRTKYLNGV
jgi:hypothetical protein